MSKNVNIGAGTITCSYDGKISIKLILTIMHSSV